MGKKDSKKDKSEKQEKGKSRIQDSFSKAMMKTVTEQLTRTAIPTT